MTHTVHPYAHRLGIIRGWKSRWFAADKKSFRANLASDEAIRRFLEKRLKGSYLAGVEIERTNTELRVIVSTARPGVVIGRSGENVAKLRAALARVVRNAARGDTRALKLDILEVRQPEANAQVVAAMVAEGLEKRLPFRRVLKSTVEKVIALREVEGVRITISGRLGGADMSRKEQVRKGRIPLQTFRADIDFAHGEAHLPYGVIGIKVWIFRGAVYDEAKKGARLPLSAPAR